MQKEAAKAGEKPVQARLARFFKTEPNAEDMEPAQVQAVKSRHKPHSGKPTPSLEKEVGRPINSIAEPFLKGSKPLLV